MITPHASIHFAFICLMSFVAAFFWLPCCNYWVISVLPAMEWLISTTDFKKRDRSCFAFHPNHPFKVLAIKIEGKENVRHDCTSIEKGRLECSHPYLYRAKWVSILRKSPQYLSMEPG